MSSSSLFGSQKKPLLNCIVSCLILGKNFPSSITAIIVNRNIFKNMTS